MSGKLIRPAVVGLVIVGALVVAGGIAYATIPDSSGVIHGCYKKGAPNNKPAPPDVGSLRVVATEKGQTCSPSEAPLDWNQTGQQGPPGQTGPSNVSSVAGY